MKKYYNIDTIGNFFPAVQGDDNSNFFRVSVVLKEAVDPKLLQEVLELAYMRYSFFFVRMRKGVFWNYLEVSKDLCIVNPEIEMPCSPIKLKKGKSNLIRFLYFQNRISIEVSHIVTDGTGAFQLLKSIVYTYFTQKYGSFDNEGKILSIEEIPTIKDYESSFSRYAEILGSKTKIEKTRVKNSYRINGHFPQKKGTSVISGCVSSQCVKSAAKTYGISITGYLCSLLMFSIFSQHIKYEKKTRPLVVAIPVNLRNFFPSETLKNFFTVCNISFTFRHDSTFEDVVASVREQMKILFTRENLEKRITHSASLENNLFASLLPLSIKNFFIKLGFLIHGESKKSITFTNMGVIDLPKGMQKFVELFEFILYPTRMSPINVASSSFMDNLSISFSLSIAETDIIRTFFLLLKEHTKSEISIYSTRAEVVV